MMDTQQVNGNIANMHGIETDMLSKDVDGFDPDEVVAGCFELRPRTRSFDLHQLTGHGGKLKFFGRLFRSPSDAGNSKQRPTAAAASPASPPVAGVTSPHHSPPHRRRLVRVVRDVNPDMYAEPNPHVVHKFSDGFFQRRRRGRTASESECGKYFDRPLPYQVTGHTILKKPSLDHSVSVNSCHSADDGTATPPTSNKHASFRNEVVVFEFDRKCNVVESSAITHVVQLHDTIFDDADSYAACKSFEEMSIDATIAALTTESTILAPADAPAPAVSTNEASATVAVDAENKPSSPVEEPIIAVAAAAAEGVNVSIDSAAVIVENSSEPAIPSLVADL